MGDALTRIRDVLGPAAYGAPDGPVRDRFRQLGVAWYDLLDDHTDAAARTRARREDAAVDLLAACDPMPAASTLAKECTNVSWFPSTVGELVERARRRQPA